MIYRTDMKEFHSSEMEAGLRRATEDVANAKIVNMNTKLDPQPIGCSSDGMESRIRFGRHDWEQNQRGQIHGGAVSGMMDTAMGMSVMAASGHNVTTAELSVSFIRPFMGDSFDIDVEILKLGRSLARVRARAFDEKSGKLLATGSADFAYID